MRVLVFGERLAPPPDEGIKKLTLSLAAALRQLGYDVLLLTTGGEDWPECGVKNVPADRLLHSQPLAQRIAAFQPDAVVYVPTASLTLASGLRARMLKHYAAGRPVALMATQGRRHYAPVQLAARLIRPDMCVVQSATTLAQARGFGWRAMRVLPGVDTDLFQPGSLEDKRRVRAAYGLPANAPVVLHVGHLNRRRGVSSLAALVDLAHPVLVASTSTGQDPALADELRAAGVQVIDRYIPEIANIYRAADCYLFPVPPDPEDPSSIDLPLSVLEAAACGLPILATRFGGLPELWAGQPGVLFYEDMAGLREGLQRLCETVILSPKEQPYDTRALADKLSWRTVAQQILDGLIR